MSSIIGLDGLVPTLKIIKFTKRIAIANKESIICGWDLIKKELNKNNINFIPVDSEHFSIWSVLRDKKNIEIDNIFITASGGPFLNKNKNQIKFAKIPETVKHPNWKMGPKISVDSATMMNKVFEVIETNKIFNIEFTKVSVLIHPDSYVHALVKFKNGITKIVIHDTSMEIPIFNSLFQNSNSVFNSNDINIEKLNNLNLKNVDYKKFQLMKIIELLPKKSSLFENILVTLNDVFVDMYLKNKINYYQISENILKFIKLRISKI